MAISSGYKSVSLEDILNRVTEFDILSFYLGINSIPCIMKSPLRQDNNPSFGLYTKDGKRIHYNDFSTRERGGLFDLLGNIWGCSYMEVLSRIQEDIDKIVPSSTSITNSPTTGKCSNIKRCIESSLDVKIRDWQDYDIKYWEDYGISLKWLKFAEVYPISHKIITKDNKRYVFVADKYAYVYVERKENKVTLKVYQPFNTKGFKWSNKHDGSVISLWTQVINNPSINNKGLCLTASLKDALCLWANTGIPSIALQGEGYSLSNTAISKLKEKFNHIYICYDNDSAGIYDAEKLALETGFTNIVLPPFKGGKDISDYRKLYGKDKFLKMILPLFTTKEDDLPF